MTAGCRWTLVGFVALVSCGDAPVGRCDLNDFNRRLARGEDVEATGCELAGTLVVGPDASFDGIDVSVGCWNGLDHWGRTGSHRAVGLYGVSAGPMERGAGAAGGHGGP